MPAICRMLPDDKKFRGIGEMKHVIISLSYFQKFDHGKQVTQRLPAGLKLKEGDTVSWECAQYSGTARVISCGPSKGGLVECTLEKTS